MKYYFNLQFKRINRHLKDLGFNIVLAYCLVTATFIIVSLLLFQKIQSAPYVYIAIALLSVYYLSAAKRNEYLKILFEYKTYRLVRLLENLIIIIPFAAFLCFKQAYFTALIISIMALILSYFNQSRFSSFALPTPFYKKPFEFITGFRKSWLLILVCYILTGIAIYVDNFNLGIFALIVSLFVALNFYLQPEPKFYVWIYAFNAASFLQHKMFMALMHILILVSPICLPLLFVYPNFWYITTTIMAVGILCLLLTILGKYAYYPTAVNLVQIIAVALSIFFPPFLIFSLPYFYMKAKQNLAGSVL